MKAVIAAKYTPVPEYYTRKEGEKNAGKNILAMLVNVILEPNKEMRPTLDEILALPFLKKYVKHERKFLSKHGIDEESGKDENSRTVAGKAAASGAAAAPPPPAPPKKASDKKLNFKRKAPSSRGRSKQDE